MAKEIIVSVVGAGRAPAVVVFQNYDPDKDTPEQNEKDAKRLWSVIAACLPSNTIRQLQEYIQSGDLLDLEELEEEEV